MTVEELFPDLAKSGYKRTSEPTEDYNCIAWAAGKQDQWWDPYPGYFWPQGACKLGTVKSAIEAFQSVGYSHCPSKDLEPSLEKIAIYAIGPNYSHAARQLDCGGWTSKIGGMEDIRHDSLEGLEGTEYGKVVYFMSRKK